MADKATKLPARAVFCSVPGYRDYFVDLWTCFEKQIRSPAWAASQVPCEALVFINFPQCLLTFRTTRVPNAPFSGRAADKIAAFTPRRNFGHPNNHRRARSRTRSFKPSHRRSSRKRVRSTAHGKTAEGKKKESHGRSAKADWRCHEKALGGTEAKKGLAPGRVENQFSST